MDGLFDKIKPESGLNMTVNMQSDAVKMFFIMDGSLADTAADGQEEEETVVDGLKSQWLDFNSNFMQDDSEHRGSKTRRAIDGDLLSRIDDIIYLQGLPRSMGTAIINAALRAFLDSHQQRLETDFPD